MDRIQLSSEQRGEYRQLLASSLNLARTYDGTEQAFEHLIHNGSALDQWMRNTFGGGQAISEEGEQQISKEAGTFRQWSINGILDVAQKRLHQCMQRGTSLEETMQELRIVFHSIDDVLLPTVPHQIETGNGGGLKLGETEPRLERLITALQNHGIYTDDLIVTMGSTASSQLRRQPYILVEIPRLHKEVLVCNQKGEATFVSQRHLALQTYLTTTKEELLHIDGVQRIISRSIDAWESNVMHALFESTEVGKKIDVLSVEALREEIRKRYPTGRDWMSMTCQEKKELNIGGMGPFAIAGKMGLLLKGRISESNFAHVLLGAALYGESDPGIAKTLQEERQWEDLRQNPAQLIAEIKKIIPTAAEWAAMTAVSKKQLKIAGRGEFAFARALHVQVTKEPCTSSTDHYLLGCAIYGANDPALLNAMQEGEGWKQMESDPKRLMEEVKKMIPTPEEWMAMTVAQRMKLKVEGKGEAAIAQALGVSLSSNPTRAPYPHLLLGVAIYGENHPAILAALEIEEEWEKLSKDPESLKAKIRQIFPTGSEWVSLSQRERKRFKILGRGEDAIATALGVPLDGRPAETAYYHLLLGAAIFGEDDAAIQPLLKTEREWEVLSKDPERLKEEIRKMIPTGKEWIAMGKTQKYQFKIAGRGLLAIAEILNADLSNRPHSTTIGHAQLGAAIYGSDDPDISASLQKADGEK